MELTTLRERLGPFLRTAGLGNDITIGELEPLTGGYSLVMARFCATIDGTEHRLVIRANPPVDEALTATDRTQEWAILEALTALGTVPMPAARCADTTGEHLGTPAIILDEVTGPQLLGHLQTVPEAELGAYADKLADAIGAVHRTDPAALPSTLERPTSWGAYIDGYLDGWRQLEANHAERNPFIRWMAAWLDEHRPAPAPLTLVHGELQTGNIMLGPDGELQLIDWEYAHIGDPRIDLGWALQCAAFMPPDLIGRDPVAFCERYCAATGVSAEVVNPLTVTWFSLLSGYKALGGLMGGMAAMAAGQNHLITSAYLVSALPFTHRMWRQGLAMLDQAFAAPTAGVDLDQVQAELEALA